MSRTSADPPGGLRSGLLIVILAPGVCVLIAHPRLQQSAISSGATESHSRSTALAAQSCSTAQGSAFDTLQSLRTERSYVGSGCLRPSPVCQLHHYLSSPSLPTPPWASGWMTYTHRPWLLAQRHMRRRTAPTRSDHFKSLLLKRTALRPSSLHLAQF